MLTLDTSGVNRDLKDFFSGQRELRHWRRRICDHLNILWQDQFEPPSGRGALLPDPGKRARKGCFLIQPTVLSGEHEPDGNCSS